MVDQLSVSLAQLSRLHSGNYLIKQVSWTNRFVNYFFVLTKKQVQGLMLGQPIFFYCLQGLSCFMTGFISSDGCSHAVSYSVRLLYRRRLNEKNLFLQGHIYPELLISPLISHKPDARIDFISIKPSLILMVLCDSWVFQFYRHRIVVSYFCYLKLAQCNQFLFVHVPHVCSTE